MHSLFVSFVPTTAAVGRAMVVVQMVVVNQMIV